MELLEKTRKINKLLQRGEKVEYNAIARLLRDVIGANIYICLLYTSPSPRDA